MFSGMFDKDGSATIDFKEFTALWNFITQWEKVFRGFDEDKSGSIDKSEFRKALTSFGNERNRTERIILCFAFISYLDRQLPLLRVLSCPILSLHRYVRSRQLIYDRFSRVSSTLALCYGMGKMLQVCTDFFIFSHKSNVRFVGDSIWMVVAQLTNTS